MFGRHLREIVDRGTPILLVDHDMGLVLGISDRVVVLEFGHVIASGTPSEVREDPNVVDRLPGLPRPAGTATPWSQRHRR